MTDRPVTELRIRLARCNHEVVFGMMETLAPDGFTYDECADGGLDLIMYAEPERAESTLLGLQNRLEQQGLAVRSTTMHGVPGDWMDRWQQFHQPLTIGRLWIGQPWHEPEPGRVPIVIDPGQGFGTGSHPTTYLVLSLLQAEQERGSVLDVGCGSGVLAIAAAKLGHANVTALDNDPAAIESAKGNVARNDVGRIEPQVVDALSRELPYADLVLANITLNPLVQLAPRLRCRRAILSGLLRSQAPAAVEAYSNVGFVLREQRDRDGWCALVLDKLEPDHPGTF